MAVEFISDKDLQSVNAKENNAIYWEPNSYWYTKNNWFSEKKESRNIFFYADEEPTTQYKAPSASFIDIIMSCHFF